MEKNNINKRNLKTDFNEERMNKSKYNFDKKNIKFEKRPFNKWGNKKNFDKKKKGLGLYKTFQLYNVELNNLIRKYEKLKNSFKNFNIYRIKINQFDISFDYNKLYGIVKHIKNGKLRIDNFFFLFKNYRVDKPWFNIFNLNNTKLKEAFSKLNRHGLAFKHIYDMIYRKILKYPYLITIKPKTIIILNYEKYINYIFEWKYKINNKIQELNDLPSNKYLRISVINKKKIIYELEKLNFFNYYIYNNYLRFKEKKTYFTNTFINNNFRIYSIIKFIYVKWEFNLLWNKKKEEINLDELLNILTSDLLEEECEDLYQNYKNEIKENGLYYEIKEKLFDYLIKKNSTHIIYYNNQIEFKEENRRRFNKAIDIKEKNKKIRINDVIYIKERNKKKGLIKSLR